MTRRPNSRHAGWTLHRAGITGTTRTETWAADSPDRVWHVERIDGGSTPWAIQHTPTGVWALNRCSTLTRAIQAVHAGRLDWYVQGARPPMATGPTPPATAHEDAAAAMAC